MTNPPPPLPLPPPPAVPDLRLKGRPTIYRCEPTWSWQPPPLFDHDIWVVMGGRGTLRLNDVAYPLQPHASFVLPPGSRLHGTQDPANRLRVFAVHFDLPDDVAIPLPPGHRVRDPALLASLIHGAIAAWRTDPATGRERAATYVRLMLLQLLAEARQPDTPMADDHLLRLLNAVQEEPGNPWTVDTMARAAGLSRSQLTRRCLEVAGLSPSRFVIRARVNRATSLLRETDMPIAAIAADLGYADVHYFSRQYRAVAGRPPGAERRLPTP